MVLCHGFGRHHLVADWRGSAVQYVLDFLQGLALSLGQQELGEQQGQYAAHGKQPEHGVCADGVGHGGEHLRQDEAQHPAETGRQGRGNGLEIGREYLSHDGPRQRAETYTYVILLLQKCRIESLLLIVTMVHSNCTNRLISKSILVFINFFFY